jgi:hypothetical protein
MGLILPLFVVLLPGGLTGLFGRGRSKSADPKKMRANSTCSRGHANTAP